MAVLAAEIGVTPRLGEGLRRAFLSAARVDFDVIDPEIFAAAASPDFSN